MSSGGLRFRQLLSLEAQIRFFVRTQPSVAAEGPSPLSSCAGVLEFWARRLSILRVC